MSGLAIPEGGTCRVALLIDWENLAVPLSAKGGEVDVQALTKLARRWGRLVDAKAYANWLDEAHSDAVPVLMEQGVAPVFVRGKHGDNDAQNAADIELMVDMLALVGRGTVDVVVLASGDEDFLPAIRQARALGATVIVVSLLRSAGPRLHYLADGFVAYEAITAGSRSPDSSTQRSAEELLTTLVNLELPHRASAPEVKELLQHDHGEFREEDLGFASFRQLLCVSEHLGGPKVDFGEVGGRVWVYPRGAARTHDNRLLPSPNQWTLLIEVFDKRGKRGMKALSEQLSKKLREIGEESSTSKVDQLLTAAKQQRVLIKDARAYLDAEGKRQANVRLVLNAGGHPRVQAYRSDLFHLGDDT